MQILKAYKFRLEPTEQQAQRLRQLGGCVMSGITGWQKPNAFWMLAKNCLLPLS
ncbi:helix-turn-helix domain-containing protein [Aeromonas caviae]|nr:helix-turn-helix domain-containing protein [Aeromonas caviae]